MPPVVPRVEPESSLTSAPSVAALLQNHPGESVFPVKRRLRYWGVLAHRSAGRNVFGQAILAMAIVAAGFYAWRASPLPFPAQSGNAVAVVVMAGIAVMLALSFARAVRSIGAPLADQERYWRLTQPPELSVRHQQILAIVLPHDLAVGDWNHSLEASPCWALLPASTRHRYRDGRRGSAFRTFNPVKPGDARERLQRAFGITSATELTTYVDALFAGQPATGALNRYGGGRVRQTVGGPSASRELVDLAEGQHWPAALPDIAGAAGVEQATVAALLHPAHGRPPQLLWGDDAAEAIQAIRLAVAADLITRDEAWTLMETPAQVAFAMYPSWEKLWEAHVVSTATAPGDDERADVIARSRENYAAALDCEWPNATLPFTPSSRAHPLPGGVRSGCGQHGAD